MKYFASRIVLLVVMATVSLTALNAHATSYIYDSLNRLTRVSYDNGSYISYAYDPAGNILQVDAVNSGPDLLLQNITFESQSPEILEATNSIVAGSNVTTSINTGDVIIKSGADVTLKSKTIIFKPGVHAERGSTLHVIAQ